MRVFLLLLALSAPLAFAAPLSGKNLLSGQVETVAPGEKGTVLVFLSAKCPCSNSHVALLKKMAAEHPKFRFVAVHSNAGEPQAKDYFQAAALPFPVLEDDHARLADEYKALKTPHAFLLSPAGRVLYKGGVTGSASAAEGSTPYLANALRDVESGKEVQQSAGRTLGCQITR